MIHVLTIVIPMIAAACFWFGAPIGDLFPAVQPLMVALSVMTAAVLVRLNRGMPTLDWKSLQTSERKRLTSSILSVTREYLQIAGVFTFFVIFLLLLTIIGKTNAEHSAIFAKLLSAFIGLLLTICVLRMSYVAWRDYDIVRLQKIIIDSTADREEAELAKAYAAEKLEVMRKAGLQSPTGNSPKPWSEKEQSAS